MPCQSPRRQGGSFTSIGHCVWTVTVLAILATTPGRAGPIFLTGHAAESFGGTTVYRGIFNQVRGRVTNGGNHILAIGVNADTNPARTWIEGVANGMNPVQTVTVINDSEIASTPFTGYAILFVPSTSFLVTGGISNTENLQLRNQASRVAAFVNAGGGVIGLSQSGVSFEYGYLTSFATFTMRHSQYNDITATAAGQELGITNTNLDGGGNHWRSVFVNYPSFLDVLATAVSTNQFVNGLPAALGGAQITIPPTIGCNAAVQRECLASDAEVTLTAHVVDPDGGGLLVHWRVNGVLVETDSVPPGGPPTEADVTLTRDYLAGAHVVRATVVDSGGIEAFCETPVTVTDTAPPEMVCPQMQVRILCAPPLIPDLRSLVSASDACAANNQLTRTQSPAPGSAGVFGSQNITMTVADPSANQAQCMFELVLEQDATAPGLNAIVAAPSHLTALITWTTTEPATTQVDFGPTSEYGQSSPLDQQLLGSHMATLTGLLPQRTYHFRVRSRDACGNEAISTDRQFNTLATDNMALGKPVTLVAGSVNGSALSTLTDGVFRPRGTGWQSGTVWWTGLSPVMEIDLLGTYLIDAAIVQGDDNDAYGLEYHRLSDDTWQTLWNVPNVDAFGNGMQTRPNPANDAERFVLGAVVLTDRVRVRAASGDNSYSVSEIQVYRQLRPDLVALSFAVPPLVTYGDAWTLDWVVRNGGDAPANGPWVESVYLSTDAVLDAGDEVLQSDTITSGLAPGGQVARQRIIPAPACHHGDYWLILELDSQNTVAESDEQNNVRASDQPTRIEIDPDDCNGNHVSDLAETLVHLTVASAQDYAAGGNAYAVATADLTGDAMPDAVVANEAAGTVSVFTNLGNGTFNAGQPLSIGSGPRGVALADFSGDGIHDVAGANFNSDSVSILINTGTGFAPAVQLPVGNGPHALAAVNVAGGPESDLVVALTNENAVAVLRNLGGGAFAAPALVAVNGGPRALAFGDCDGDLDMDVLVACSGLDVVRVLRNSGGALQAGEAIAVGDFPAGICMADLDGDADLDAAVSNTLSSTVTVLVNNGGGQFSAAAHHPVGDSPRGLDAADLDGDGLRDLCVANFLDDRISILRNQGGLAFAPGLSINAEDGVFALQLADVNQDGRPDLLSVARHHDVLAVRHNTSGSAVPDCNRNRTPDTCEVMCGGAADVNTNGIPDECEGGAGCGTCRGDLTGDLHIDGADIGVFVSCLTNSAGCECGDFTQDGAVSPADLPSFVERLLNDADARCP